MNAIAFDRHRPRDWAIVLAFIVVVVAIGGLIGIGARPDAWYQSLAKAPWNPPNWVFAPVWFTLYLLIGIAGARTYLREPRGVSMLAWIAQMLLNWAWSPVWFGLHLLWPAFAVIAAIFALIVGFIGLNWRDDRVAAWLFVPYALWVAFAATLNLAAAILN